MPSHFFVRGVAEVTSTEGVGSYVLGGALPGFARFSELVPDGALVNYSVSDGARREWAQGVFNAPLNTLTRGQVSFASGGGASVNWGSGRKIVTLELGDDPGLSSLTVQSAASFGLAGDVAAGPGTGVLDAVLSETGVTAGTYTNSTITVDKKGRLTSAATGGGGGGGGSGGLFSNLIANGPPPDLSHWTALNVSGSAAVADSAAGPIITDGLNNGHQKRALVMLAPTPPYSADFLLAVDLPSETNVGVGVGWNNVGATAVGSIGVIGNVMGIVNYTNSTTLSGTWKLANRVFSNVLCFRIRDNGPGPNTVAVYRSMDGENFNLHFSDSRTIGQIHCGTCAEIGLYLDMDSPNTPDPSVSGSVTLLALYIH